MSEFSEQLPSGLKVSATGMDFKPFVLEASTGNCVYLTRSDIARMYGIAFPEKRRTGECSNTTASTEVDDINVVDIQIINSPE